MASLNQRPEAHKTPGYWLPAKELYDFASHLCFTLVLSLAVSLKPGDDLKLTLQAVAQ